MTAHRHPVRHQPATQVELTIDELVVPTGYGDEQLVREAVEGALRTHLSERISGEIPTTTRHADVAVSLREPIATDVWGLGRQVAAEITKAVLP